MRKQGCRVAVNPTYGYISGLDSQELEDLKTKKSRGRGARSLTILSYTLQLSLFFDLTDMNKMNDFTRSKYK